MWPTSKAKHFEPIEHYFFIKWFFKWILCLSAFSFTYSKSCVRLLLNFLMWRERLSNSQRTYFENKNIFSVCLPAQTALVSTGLQGLRHTFTCGKSEIFEFPGDLCIRMLWGFNLSLLQMFMRMKPLARPHILQVASRLYLRSSCWSLVILKCIQKNWDFAEFKAHLRLGYSRNFIFHARLSTAAIHHKGNGLVLCA
jgi:hypothetical protein